RAQKLELEEIGINLAIQHIFTKSFLFRHQKILRLIILFKILKYMQLSTLTNLEWWPFEMFSDIEEIFMDSFDYININDLDLCISQLQANKIKEIMGVILYIASELFMGSKYSIATNVYAFSINVEN
ncbi:4843_t:CDS:2, partial [Dentiscutata erythropus]